MKTIKKSEYHGDGILINLDTTFNPYTNLLVNHYKYLDKSKKYYFYCHGGTKSRKVTAVLEAYGYDVTQVR